MINITISQFWKEFKQMDNTQKLKFIFPNKEEERVLKRVETKNIITARIKDGVMVWLNKPKKDTIFKDNDTYILKGYLCDNADLIIIKMERGFI